MAEHALVSPQNAVDRFATNVDPTVQTRAGWRWLPVERTVAPLAANRVHEPTVTTVLADKVTVVTAARDKTASEIDADKDARLGQFDVLAFQVLFNHENRLRALEAQPALTAAQFHAALKERL
jgi:hypothetical protein